MMNSKQTRNLQVGPIAGIGVGSFLMYFLDPQRGARRRARVVEQSLHSLHKTETLFDKAYRDTINRGQGLLAKGSGYLKSKKEVDDTVLVARIRSKMGRYISHPHAIEVKTNQGEVTLKGLALESEVQQFLMALQHLSGVKKVNNQLEVHKPEENLPSLQGGTLRTGEKFDLFQTQWAPATRVFAGAVGSAFLTYGYKRGGFFGGLVGILGTSLSARSITNQDIFHLFGIGKGRSAIQVQKIINLDASLERVFEFWSNFENFPKFLTDVKEVKKIDDTRSHWIVAGPAATPIIWEALMTEKVENSVIAWKSLPGALIPNSGAIHFRPSEDGGTRLEIKISYTPPAGSLGHFAARLFGADPKSKLDEALSQIKTLIEQGPSERQLRRAVS